MKTLLAILACAALLAACGGGSGGASAPAASEAAPVDATLDLTTTLAGQPSETADPLMLSDAPMPASETDDPKAP